MQMAMPEAFEETRDEITERLMPLARRLAKAYAKEKRLDRVDCESSAMEGLLNAIDKHAPDKGPIEPYAEACIRNAMKRGGYDHQLLPKQLIKDQVKSFSISESDFDREDPFGPPPLVFVEVAQRLASILKQSEVSLIRLKYDDQLTDDEIADKLSIGRSAASKRLQKIYQKLRGFSREEITDLLEQE